MSTALATAIDLQRFGEQGFLVVEDLLDPERDLQLIVDEYTELLGTICDRWYAEGKLSSTYADLPFGERLIAAVAESQEEYFQVLDIALPVRNLTEQTPIHLGRAVFDLLRNPRLLDAVSVFLGSEIYCNPVQHVRIKVPERLVPDEQRNAQTAATAWHQDQGVVLPEADDTEILTVWLPVTDANVENGCLLIAKGSHRYGLQPHCPPNERENITHIPEKFRMPELTAPVPMKRGSVLFMHRRTMHASLPNLSDGIRWSFDLRYNRVGEPTGRPSFPGFVARSTQHPERVLTDHAAWQQMWYAARRAVAAEQSPSFDRWSSDAPACA